MLPPVPAQPTVMLEPAALANAPYLGFRLAVTLGTAAGWAEASLVAIVAAVASSDLGFIEAIFLIPITFAVAAWTGCFTGTMGLGFALGAIVRSGCRRRNWLAPDRIDYLPMSAGAIGAVLAPMNVPAWTGVVYIGATDVGRVAAIGLGALAIPFAGLVTGYALGVTLRNRVLPNPQPRFPLAFGIGHLLALVLAFAVTFWVASTIARSV